MGDPSFVTPVHRRAGRGGTPVLGAGGSGAAGSGLGPFGSGGGGLFGWSTGDEDSMHSNPGSLFEMPLAELPEEDSYRGDDEPAYDRHQAALSARHGHDGAPGGLHGSEAAWRHRPAQLPGRGRWDHSRRGRRSRGRASLGGREAAVHAGGGFSDSGVGRSRPTRTHPVGQRRRTRGAPGRGRTLPPGRAPTRARRRRRSSSSSSSRWGGRSRSARQSTTRR